MKETMERETEAIHGIPTYFLQWLVTSRIRFLEGMKAGRPMRYFSAHLPVMATWKEGEEFPVNLTVKGIGLIPKKDILSDYIDLFEATIAEARTMPWTESLSMRIEVMERLYSDIENLDPELLGGLEIFEGTAFKNMRDNSVASLLYMGVSAIPEDVKTVDPQRPVAVEYISFQINGRVEILKKDNIYYRYLLAARRLFEFDRFHIYQPDYPYGYLIKVVEVKDKSPWPLSQKK
ncbi:MAG: hypothetical protein ACK4TF_05880 [Thermodesulfovibrionales bacterium]